MNPFNRTVFESKEVLVMQMKAALVELILETNTPDEILIQYQKELEEVQSMPDEELREKGMIK